MNKDEKHIVDIAGFAHFTAGLTEDMVQNPEMLRIIKERLGITEEITKRCQYKDDKRFTLDNNN